MSSLRADLGGRIDATQTMMMRFGSGLMVAMAGVIAAVLLQG
jgi:gamma-glutamyltranspeptidase